MYLFLLQVKWPTGHQGDLNVLEISRMIFLGHIFYQEFLKILSAEKLVSPIELNYMILTKAT